MRGNSRVTNIRNELDLSIVIYSNTNNKLANDNFADVQVYWIHFQCSVQSIPCSTCAEGCHQDQKRGTRASATTEPTAPARIRNPNTLPSTISNS